MKITSLKTVFLSAAVVGVLGCGLTPMDAEAAKLRKDTKLSVNKNINNNRNRNINVNKNVNVNVDVNHRHGHPIARGVAIGTAAAVTAAVIGSIVYSLPPSCTRVIVNGVTYQQCGTTWYQPQVVGGNTQYIVINAPQ